MWRTPSGFLFLYKPLCSSFISEESAVMKRNVKCLLHNKMYIIVIKCEKNCHEYMYPCRYVFHPRIRWCAVQIWKWPLKVLGKLLDFALEKCMWTLIIDLSLKGCVLLTNVERTLITVFCKCSLEIYWQDAEPFRMETGNLLWWQWSMMMSHRRLFQPLKINPKSSAMNWWHVPAAPRLHP